MNRKEYTPQKIDTSKIELPADLIELTELMARNVHEVWAETRIAQGWKWGTQRSDRQRLHPCLVPYDELPEMEKIYDRKTATETLKLIQILGYEIKKR